MSRSVQLLLVPIAMILALAGCSTPSAVSPAPAPVAPVGAAPAKAEVQLADEIQQVIGSIDQILNRYEGMLSTIQKLPDARNPARLFDEVGNYISSERFESVQKPTEEQISAGIVDSFSFSSRVTMTETGVETDLRDLTRRLFSLNARTAELADDYEQGRTLQNYAGRMRRELMPLMAQLRSLALADRNDVATVARLDAETQKILKNSRQSLHALERQTRDLELEIGGK